MATARCFWRSRYVLGVESVIESIPADLLQLARDDAKISAIAEEEERKNQEAMYIWNKSTADYVQNATREFKAWFGIEDVHSDSDDETSSDDEPPPVKVRKRRRRPAAVPGVKNNKVDVKNTILLTVSEKGKPVDDRKVVPPILSRIVGEANDTDQLLQRLKILSDQDMPWRHFSSHGIHDDTGMLSMHTDTRYYLRRDLKDSIRQLRVLTNRLKSHDELSMYTIFRGRTGFKKMCEDPQKYVDDKLTKGFLAKYVNMYYKVFSE
jgi:hypothetical protein